MKEGQIKRLFQEYLLNTYRRSGPVFVKGKGSWLFDLKGKPYLDLFPGWGVSILGYSHRRIVRVIREQAHNLLHLPNNLFSPEQALLAKEIVKNSFAAKIFFANSGAEAIEGAIKFSRLYGRGRRYEIITMKGSFHGRTFGALSATGQERYRAPFKPLLAEFKEVPLNDFEALRASVNEKTVGVILELIQGEGGINIADKEYIKKLREFTLKRDLLLIIDEVQTGIGRSGNLFCYQHYGIKPDVMVLSKGLGAGVPISALVVKKEIADLFQPGMHASTFGGSPLVCRTSLEVFKIIKEEKILENVRRMGKYLFERLLNLKEKFSFIKEVRGIGLMLGVELEKEGYGVFLECLRQGLIINCTQERILRIMPALNINQRDLDKGLAILERVFSKLKGNFLSYA